MKKFKLLTLGFLVCGAALFTADAREMNIDEDEGEGMLLSELLTPRHAEDARGFSSASTDASSEMYTYGIELENAGQLKRAQRQFKKVVRRAPHDPLAAAAQQRLADIYFRRGKYSKAKTAYDDLLKNYGAQADYDVVLDSVIKLAQAQKTERHMEWLFGGFTSPESAIATLELVVRYGPATRYAPASQYRIGHIYQQNGDLDEAVAAYDVVLFRYPESTVAERAALAKADCLRRLSQQEQNNETARAEAWTACKVFLSMFPESEDRAQVEEWGVELYLARAQDLFNKAVFYETIARKPAAAKIYYRIVANDFSESSLADKAQIKLEALQKKESADA